MRRSPLFAAVVLAGTALGAACGDETTAPDRKDGGDDAGAPADAGTTEAAAVVPDAGDAPRKDAGLCPPGSDRPVPPCSLIK